MFASPLSFTLEGEMSQHTGVLTRWPPHRDLPGGASDKEPACWCRRHKIHWFDCWVGKIFWRRERQPTPVFLPGKFHGQRPGRLQFMGSQRVGLDWSDLAQIGVLRWEKKLFGNWKETCYEKHKSIANYSEKGPLSITELVRQSLSRGIRQFFLFGGNVCQLLHPTNISASTYPQMKQSSHTSLKNICSTLNSFYNILGLYILTLESWGLFDLKKIRTCLIFKQMTLKFKITQSKEKHIL